MKYKIVKKESKTLHHDNVLIDGVHKDVITVNHSIWYIAKRKGRIFGFWHKIGHECDYEGDLIAYSTKTVEDMEDYIRKWHEVKYFNKPIEIIKEISI